ncbi:TolC family protein [uncultured Pseudodesulfovibrio sp.]|uniref:TolC family protein n=1 Tax=uncultured Pseudodesulfovibrio sp. TaxID=2035858 RepID=UPI0029C7BCA6|nr:TolC family protein [uncultured Pseudodesulfovibrio sp.]
MKSLIKFLAMSFVLIVFAVFSVSSASAQDDRNLNLDALLENLVKNHDRIKASEAQLQSVKHQYEGAKGGWLPRVDATAEGGRENLSKPGSAETQKSRNEETLSATQLLYDFGGVSGTIDSAAGRIKEFDSILLQTKQEIVSLGITAYLRVIRSRELLKYARRSEESIMELSGMQEVLVERGAGYSYEELQVKGQLAGAQSYRVTQERELQTSINNFKSVFGFAPTMEEVGQMATVPVPRKYLPGNVDEAVTIAYEKNPLLLETKYSLERLQGDLSSGESKYYPRFDAVLEHERKENDQGTPGVRTEQRASVQMTYNLFSGFQDKENIQSVKSEMTSAKRTLLDRRRTVEESVRNAWLELTTLRQNSELYENQANITWEFLGLVKKKKATGEEVRLLDILVGERDYISAISAKVATDIDIIIAGYTLLYQMGLITEDITES